MNKYLLTLLTVMSFLRIETAFAQFGDHNAWAQMKMNENAMMGSGFLNVDPYKSRFNEIGIIAGIGSPVCKAYYYISDNKGGAREKSVTAKAKTSLNYGLSIGSGIHLATLSDDKSLALNIAATFVFSKASITNNELGIKNGTDFKEEVELLRSGIPISLDYKSGAEAASDKYLKSMFAMGAGIAPRFISEGFLGGYAIPSLSPFLKVEAGYFLGVAFKIRGMYYFGEQVWSDTFFSDTVSSDQLNVYGSFYKLYSKGEFQLSLVIMPYSGSWE